MTPPPTLLSPEGGRHTCPGYLDDPPEIQRVINEAGFWIGCEHPERPADEFMVTMAGCRGCEIAHQAADRRCRLTVDAFTSVPIPIAARLTIRTRYRGAVASALRLTLTATRAKVNPITCRRKPEDYPRTMLLWAVKPKFVVR